MPKTSAGLVLYRGTGADLEVLLVHPGGPMWARRHEGAWSIPKGEIEPGEEPLSAACREFAEELGHQPPGGEALDLGEIRQRGGKVVRGFALAGDLDPATIVSERIEVEWPPRSGQTIEIPEVDRAEWFAPAAMREAINPAQIDLIERLYAANAGDAGGA